MRKRRATPAPKRLRRIREGKSGRLPGKRKRMNIVCIGGGPAGLYFGILMKKQDPANEVVVVNAIVRTTPSAGASSSPTRRSAIW